MSHMPSCNDCRHFHALAQAVLDRNAPAGECRRYPPTRSDHFHARGHMQISAWPTVQRTMCCGEHAPLIELAT